jgi:hypothetical protein
MLTSILTPVVHGDDRQSGRRAWLRLAALHSLGMIVSAALAGATLSGIAWAASRFVPGYRFVVPWVLASVALLYLPRLLGWADFPPLLQSTRQVPRRWAYDYPRWAASLFFGLGLGSGCYTRIVVPTFYLLVIWPLLAPGPVWPLVVWTTYGLARSCNVWWLALRAPLRDPFRHASTMVSVLTRRQNDLQLFNAVVLAIVAAWSAAWLLR